MKPRIKTCVVASLATFITALGVQLAPAQTSNPVASVMTDLPGYLTGQTVLILGDGFQVGETVVLQVVLPAGTSCPTWTETADPTGAILSEWTISADVPTNATLQLTATGLSSGQMADTTFANGAAISTWVRTDQADYAPGSTVYITGGGFDPGETVTLQVVPTDGTDMDDTNHQPWTVVADAEGVFQTTWIVGDNDLGASFQLLASRDPSKLAAWTAFTDSDGGSCPLFTVAAVYAVGSYTRSVAVGDFNGDGHPDLAVVNLASSTVSVLLNNGSGGFLAAVNYTPGSHPRSVAVGDFNSDGHPDLAVANQSSANVSVLLNNGSGGFLTAVNYAVGLQLFWVAVGDFNGDGKPDLAVADNAPSGTVSVLLNNGSGGFLAAVNYAAGAYPSSVAVGDFNGDGKADLAVPNSIGSGTVSVLLNNGSGGFLPRANYAAGVYPSSVAVGDFNGDGKADLVVPNDVSANVSVLLNNGSGGFLTAVNYAAGSHPISVAVGDFNGDGHPDLAVANSTSATVSVLLNNGSGGFLPAVNCAAGPSPASVAVGDFNGDGKPDLAVANFSGTVSVLLGNSCNQPPVAKCKDATVDAGPTGTATASIDDGSYDPDGDTITLGQDPPGPYSLGTTTVTLTVTDSHGAFATGTATVTVVDVTPPVIGTPLLNLTVPASVNLLEPVTFTLPPATDNCDPNPTVTALPASGSGFPIGTTTVTVTATDAFGNSSTATFTVTRAALDFTGFLSPIGGEVAQNTGGSFADPVRAFKLKSTIPVKFVAGTETGPVTTGVHTLQAFQYSSAEDPAPAIDATPTDAATTGNQFRLTDAATGEWHFNVGTKAGFSQGIWLLRATLSDGSTHDVWISIKK